ncbi:hypothetical protein BDY21DRAFT_423372 [Lineolata rhizophorae]|uniref:NACHT domain-containing protein n=1 Tax=Lineolata rhizophorae TaxID=578093 RepID=A0A6A6NSX1_9PEZI|nr:hypothetical protein BDY21DRAFT_423372 [Lineolata rhizophorae]
MSYLSIKTREKDLRKYVGTLEDAEKRSFLRTTSDLVVLDAKTLEEKHASCSRTRRFCRLIDPFVSFLRRHARAVDVIVQCDVSPSAIAWGCLRFLVEVFGSLNAYFRSLISMMEKLVNKLRFCQRYEEIYSDWKPFREALAEVYFDIITFLCKARRVFKSNGLKTFGKVLWTTFEGDFEEILDALSVHIEVLNEETKFAHRRLAHMDRRKDVMEWLAPVDTADDLMRRSKRRASETGEWMLQNDAYRDWRDFNDKEPALWIHGRPGSGKSMLCAKIVEDLQARASKGEGPAYFFFNKNEKTKTTLLSVVSSILSQLLGQMRMVPQSVLCAFESAANRGRTRMAMSDDPVKLLNEVVEHSPKTYVILDGLDECEEADSVLKEFLNLANFSGVRILCLSHDTTTIRKFLGKRPTIKLRTSLVRKDIDLYLRSEIEELASELGEKDLTELIFHRLAAGADGIFLWAYLMIQTLKDAPNREELELMTRRLPEGLGQIYDSILDDLRKQSEPTQVLASQLFLWVCCSTRPLSWPELRCALSFNEATNAFDQRRQPFKNAVLRVCSPLLEYDAEQDLFRPAHISVCEYLENKDRLSVPQGSSSGRSPHVIIAQTCLHYLALPAVADSIIVEPKRNPLSNYATLNWCHHLFQAPACDSLISSLQDFTSSASRRHIWTARWLLLQMAAWPLQRILKQQRAVQDWVKKNAPGGGLSPSFDVLEDIFGALLFLDNTSRSEETFGDVSSGLRIGHFERMMAVRDLARAYALAGRLKDAENWLESALREQQNKHGKNAPQTIWLLNSLGLILDQQSRFQLAVDTQSKALGIQKEKLPPNHMDTAWTISELGRIYRHLLKLGDAEWMHLQALRVLGSIFPEDDPQIVWNKNTLARTYRFQHRFEECLAIHEYAFATQQRSLGPEHAHTLWTLSDISRCQRDMGRLNDALESFLRVLDGRRMTLGAQHPDTLWSMNDVGLLLAMMGRNKEECGRRAFSKIGRTKMIATYSVSFPVLILNPRPSMIECHRLIFHTIPCL